MRILHIGKFYPVAGGVEKVMYDLVSGLSARGVDCDMLCADADCKGRREVRLNAHGRILVCRTLTKIAGTMLSPEMLFRTRQLLKSRADGGKPYDVVHIHHPDPMAALSLLLSGWRGPVVLHWHSDIVRQNLLLKLYKPLQNWLIRRSDVIVGTSPVYLRESPHLREVLGAEVMDRISTGGGKYLIVNEFQLSPRRRSFCFQNSGCHIAEAGRKVKKLAVLPIGVHRIIPSPEKVAELRSRFNDKKIVFSLGRMVPYKGFRYLVEAASLLPEDYVVAIGGSGPLRPDLESLAASKGLLADGGKSQDAKVVFLGRVADKDLPQWYGAADVFCLSSVQKSEAFAIVQIEAMSCGTPVVSCNIPESGVPWVNRDGDSGIVVPVRDAKALADAIIAVTKDEEVRKQFSERALQRWQDLFEYEDMVGNCLELYYLCTA